MILKKADKDPKPTKNNQAQDIKSSCSKYGLEEFCSVEMLITKAASFISSVSYYWLLSTFYN